MNFSNTEYFESSFVNVNGKNIKDDEIYLSKNNNNYKGYIKKKGTKRKLSNKKVKNLIKKLSKSKQLRLSKRKNYHLENYTKSKPFKFFKSKRNKNNKKKKL